MRFLQRFYVVWGIVLALVVWAQLREMTGEVSVQDLNTAAESILLNLQYPFVLLAILFCYRVLARRSKGTTRSGIQMSREQKDTAPVKLSHVPRQRVGRVSRCYQCKRQIVEHTGSNCHFCHWIRCRCGACGCGFGKMV